MLIIKSADGGRVVVHLIRTSDSASRRTAIISYSVFQRRKRGVEGGHFDTRAFLKSFDICLTAAETTRADRSSRSSLFSFSFS